MDDLGGHERGCGEGQGHVTRWRHLKPKAEPESDHCGNIDNHKRLRYHPALMRPGPKRMTNVRFHPGNSR